MTDESLPPKQTFLMNTETSSSFSKLRSSRLSFLLAFSPLLLLLPMLIHASLNRHLHARCPHIILLTQARHGSTWLLDSVEKCRFSRMEQVEAHVYGKRVYLDTELWHLHKTTLHNVSASAALSYVRNNCSVKLFPPALKEKRGRVRELMMGAKEMEIPIVILRRNVADSFASFKAAMSSGDWARVLEKEDLDNEGSGESFDGEGLEKWQNDTRAFFDGVVDIAKEGNVNFDELYYEDIKKREWVWLRVARCYIRSCNYG